MGTIAKVISLSAGILQPELCIHVLTPVLATVTETWPANLLQAETETERERETKAATVAVNLYSLGWIGGKVSRKQENRRTGGQDKTRSSVAAEKFMRDHFKSISAFVLPTGKEFS